MATRLEAVYARGGKISGKKPKLLLNDGSFNASFSSFFPTFFFSTYLYCLQPSSERVFSFHCFRGVLINLYVFFPFSHFFFLFFLPNLRIIFPLLHRCAYKFPLFSHLFPLLYKCSYKGHFFPFFHKRTYKFPLSFCFFSHRFIDLEISTFLPFFSTFFPTNVRISFSLLAGTGALINFHFLVIFPSKRAYKFSTFFVTFSPLFCHFFPSNVHIISDSLVFL